MGGNALNYVDPIQFPAAISKQSAETSYLQREVVPPRLTLHCFPRLKDLMIPQSSSLRLQSRCLIVTLQRY